MIHAIWAMDVNWLMGDDNKLPWHYKEDLEFFKTMTNGKSVLMGDKTYYSLKSYYKNTPLPFGKIYVASLEPLSLDDAENINDVVEFVSNYKNELWITGGSAIYDITLPYVDLLHITHILNVHEGNIYIKRFQLSEYKLVKKQLKDNLLIATYKK